MKTSTALHKAFELQKKIDKLLEPHNKRIADLLGDDCAHFAYQASDGFVIAYRGGKDNAAVSFIDIDAIMDMDDKNEILAIIDKAGI